MLKTGPYRHPKFGGSPKKPYLCTAVRKKAAPGSTQTKQGTHPFRKPKKQTAKNKETREHREREATVKEKEKNNDASNKNGHTKSCDSF